MTWPLDFNFNISPTDIVPSLTDNPATSPPVNDKAEALTIPLASTEKPDDEINNSVLVAAPLMKKLSELKASVDIVNPPISPVVAVMLPATTTSPLELKWKLLELISIMLLLPLMNCVVWFPTKKASVFTSRLVPSNFRKLLPPFPTWNLGLPISSENCNWIPSPP